MSTPYYPGITITPNLGLSLVGMDEVVAEDFILLDAFAGGVSGSIEVNSSVVNSPNFIDSASATFSVSGSNISITVSGSEGSGISIPTAGTVSPSPAFPTPEAPSGVNPAFYVQDANGEWHAQAGMDTTTVVGSPNGPTVPQGILLFDRIMYFRDTQSPVQTGKNAFISVNHAANVGTSYGNQDRAIWATMGNITAQINSFSINGSNVVTFSLGAIDTGFTTQDYVPFVINQRISASALSIGTYLNGVALTILTASAIVGGVQTITASDSGFTHAAVGTTLDTGRLDQVLYGMANIQMEQDIIGSPTLVSGVDTEFSVLSLQLSDQHTGTISAPNYGSNAIRAQYYRESGAGSWGSNHPACIRSIVTDNNDGTHGFDTMTNIMVIGTTVSGNADAYYGIHVLAPAVRFGGGQYGILIDSFGANSSDYSLSITGGQINLGGTITAVGAWPSTTANFVLAGPASGANAAATFRAIVAADLPVFVGDSGTGGVQGAVPAPSAGIGSEGYFLSAAGNWQIPSVPASSVAWNNITSATGPLSVSNGTNATEFDQTSAVIWSWKNKTAATGTLNQSSPVLELAGRYYSGSDAEDNWTIQDVVANGTNKLAQLVFTHTGTSGPAQIAVPATAGSASTPSLVLGSSLNTGGTYGPGFLCPSAGSIGFHPGDSSSSNVGLDLRFYRISSGTPTYSFDMQSASASAGGLILSCQENANALQQIIVASAQGTAAGIGIVLGGNGGNNTHDFSATSGTQVAVSVGASPVNEGRVTFDPTSGTASFVGLQVAPTINQTGSASGSYTALLVNPTETAVLGTANKLLDLQVGGTSKFSVDNKGNTKLNRINTSGTDFSGTATITAGGTTVAVSFSANYATTNAPIVVITPTSDPLVSGTVQGYWITYSGSTGAWTGFTVNIQAALAGNVTFNYICMGQS